MECVVQVVRGSKLDPKGGYCIFCGEEAVSLFCNTKEDKYDGTLLYVFPVCKQHLDKINALLSGEFEIDNIFLEKYRVKHKNVQLRRFPPIGIAPTKNNKSLKQCEFLGCTNKFTGIVNQKYCHDPRCIELRKEYFSQVKYTQLKDPDAKNIVLAAPGYKRKLKSGQVLKLRCRARNSLGIRCKNIFYITFDLKQRVYPMFCECHRSAYKRQLYLKKE